MTQQHGTSTRFRVIKAGKEIQLNGAINDTTKFDSLNEMISAENRIVCSGLLSVSWIGLTSFCRYLADTGKPVVLVSVPGFAFGYLKIVQDLGTNITIENAELPFFVPHAPEFTLAMVEQKALYKLYEDKGQFIDIGGKNLFGVVSHHCMMAKLTAYTPPPDFTNPWCKENSEEAAYLYNYMFFTVTTIGLAIDIVRSVDVSLSLSLSNIITRINNALAGLAVLIPQFYNQEATSLVALLKKVNSECAVISTRIDEYRKQIEICIREFQEQSLTEGNADGAGIYSVFQKSSNVVVKCRELAKTLEEVGSAIGQGILGLAVVNTLKELMNRIKASLVTTELLEKIRDKFNIMNPMSADSWQDTRQEIFDELDQIDADVGRCVVVLQGFDLARQVIEHRILEGEMLMPKLIAVQKKEIHWTEMKKNLADMIANKLVTEQEKAAYSFYIPEGYAEYSKNVTSKSPGAVLLF